MASQEAEGTTEQDGEARQFCERGLESHARFCSHRHGPKAVLGCVWDQGESRNVLDQNCGGSPRHPDAELAGAGLALSSRLCPLLCVHLRSEVHGPGWREERQSHVHTQQSMGESGQRPGQAAKPTYSWDRILGKLMYCKAHQVSTHGNRLLERCPIPYIIHRLFFLLKAKEDRKSVV